MTLQEERIIAAIWGEAKLHYRNAPLSPDSHRIIKSKKLRIIKNKTTRLKIS